MMRLPRITVVTPTYNQAEFITETLESIHGQNYPELEHIVMDGGSDDGTVEILERWDGLITHWESGPDEGQTDALIKGFRHATGDILCWLNSDDLFYPRTLREVAERFTADRRMQFIYGDATWINRRGDPIVTKREHGFNRFIWFYDHNFIPQPSAFWTRDIYEQVGGLDPLFDYAMDADLWIRFADVTKPVHARRMWSMMRFYPEQKNTQFRHRTQIEGGQIRSRYGPPPSQAVSTIAKYSAKTLRKTYKLITGGYPMSEFPGHLRRTLRGISWEEEELARQKKASVGD